MKSYYETEVATATAFLWVVGIAAAAIALYLLYSRGLPACKRFYAQVEHLWRSRHCRARRWHIAWMGQGARIPRTSICRRCGLSLLAPVVLAREFDPQTWDREHFTPSEVGPWLDGRELAELSEVEAAVYLYLLAFVQEGRHLKAVRVDFTTKSTVIAVNTRIHPDLVRLVIMQLEQRGYVTFGSTNAMADAFTFVLGRKVEE